MEIRKFKCDYCKKEIKSRRIYCLTFTLGLLDNREDIKSKTGSIVFNNLDPSEFHLCTRDCLNKYIVEKIQLLDKEK